MKDKRHLVLYAAGAIALITIALVFMVRGGQVSDMTAISEPTAVFEPIATTSQVRDEPEAPSAPSPKPFTFEIVTDKALQNKGLSGRATIPQNYGMLFVFPQKEKVGFWMKDMLAPIDIIWISDDEVIVGVVANASPDSYKKKVPDVFYPPEPVRYVLETKAGEAARLGLSVGTKIALPLPYGE